MRIVSLSHVLSELTPGYGGSVGFEQIIASQISEGASSNSKKWTLSNHIGTHIDFPLHFDDEGKSLSDFEASDWVFQTPFLLEYAAEAEELIPPSVFESVPIDADFVILKTGFEAQRGNKEYWNNNPGLSPESGDWIRQNRPNLKVLGFDFISITSYQHRMVGREAHRRFLSPKFDGGPLRVVEDMKLAELHQSPKQLVVSPLLVKDADGSPVTVFAFLK